ncbi:MAG TPA: hypothetical protein VFD63_08175 [Pyrinomonadaceae bacterium]|nr:hypothetical protein [Pyrinomonadaceae bacterium]
MKFDQNNTLFAPGLLDFAVIDATSALMPLPSSVIAYETKGDS